MVDGTRIVWALISTFLLGVLRVQNYNGPISAFDLQLFEG